MEILRSRDVQVAVLVGTGGVLLIYGVLVVVGALVRPWRMALASGVRLELPRLIGMRLRKTDPELIVMAHIADQKRGPKHTLDVLEAVYLAKRDDIRTGGRLLRLADEEVARQGGGAA